MIEIGQTVTLAMDSRPLNAGKRAALGAVAVMYTDAVKWLLLESASFDRVSRTVLNRELYAIAREKFPLQATLIQTATQDALQIRRGYLTAVKERAALNRRRGRQGKDPKKDIAEPNIQGILPIAFRQDTWKLIETRNGFSVQVPTMSIGRGHRNTVSVPLVVSDYHRTKLAILLDGSARKASLRLVLHQDGTCRIFLSLDVPVEEITTPVGWLGVDLGIVNVAVTSTAKFYGGREVRYRKNRWHERRKDLQTHGRLARVKKERGRESDWVRDTNHKIANALVFEAKVKGLGIALENLTGFHSRTDGQGKKLDRMNHGWSFNQLRDFVVYKAALAGVPVTFVDPRNTSKTCSKCGHYSRSSRETRDIFRCATCGFELNADLNAARNIAAKAAANYAERAYPTRKGECDTPNGSRPPANAAGPVQANLSNSRFGKPSPKGDGGCH